MGQTDFDSDTFTAASTDRLPLLRAFVQVVAHFERWARNPEVRDWFNREWTSPEERARRIREIFGLPPEPPVEASASPPGSSRVKPSQGRSK